jgi:hypothetical protein
MSKSVRWEHVTARPRPIRPPAARADGPERIEEQAGWVGEPATLRAEFEREVRTARAGLRGVTLLLLAALLMLVLALLSMPRA